MATNLICRFDHDHGRFVTPVKLSEHYREYHADVWVGNPPNTKRYRCELCGGVFRNPSSHVRQRHPDEATTPVVGRIMIRVDDGAIATGRRPVSKVPDVLGEVRDIEDQRRKSNGHGRHVGPWDVDDIVLPVVEQLASPKGLVPVGHLAALFDWRDATARMLAAVTGG
jgi:hypothetical protein